MSSISSRGPSSTENDSRMRNNRSGGAGGGGGSSGPQTQDTPPPSPTGSSDRGSKACCFCWCCCCSCSWWVHDWREIFHFYRLRMTKELEVSRFDNFLSIQYSIVNEFDMGHIDRSIFLHIVFNWTAELYFRGRHVTDTYFRFLKRPYQ